MITAITAGRIKGGFVGGWIGVDFDGTLVYEQPESFPTPGRPIPKMLNRVKGWLADGKEVRIVTARVGACTQEEVTAVGFPQLTPEQWIAQQRLGLENWCMAHLGQILEITCSKDFKMVELWDDRAVQLIPNSGMTLQEDLLMRVAAGKPVAVPVVGV